MATPLVFDANVLWSFAVVGRVDLLRNRYGYRSRWTSAVESEISRNEKREISLLSVTTPSWLPPAIEFETSELSAIMRIRGILASPGEHPAKHLGEAESIYYIERHLAKDAIFITDDRFAADLARHRGLTVHGTSDVMRDCHSMGEVGCPDAWDIMRLMEGRGRTVHTPAHHSMVC